MIKYFTILGERASGTTFLEEAILSNFDIEIIWEYGWKHEFGFNKYNNCDNVLFLGITRNIVDWINSLYENPWHLSNKLTSSKYNFLNNEFCSYYDDGKEILSHRNIYTKERYKNIFECRKVKAEYLLNDMKHIVKNYYLIKYEDLLDNYETLLVLIGSKYNLHKKNNNIININYYKKTKDTKFIKKNYSNIIKEEIYNNKLFYKDIEIKLGYNIS